MSTDLSSLPFDQELAPGAANAVSPCLDIRPDENVVLITDRPTLEVGAALAAAFEPAAKEVRPIVLEDLAPRPLRHMPAEMDRAMRWADVSVFAAVAMPGELDMRRAMTAVVNAKGMRHAHMVGVTNRIMMEGMRADFLEIQELTEWVRQRAMQADEIRCKTPAGTDLRATFDPRIKWIPTPGIISAAKWSNLPGGETFTSPARVDGVFVVDGVLGDWLAPKYGDMRDHPMVIHIEDSRIARVSCDHAAALADFLAYTSTDENSNRVGEFALGTNTWVKGIIGNMLQDEKIPGVHIAFGHPYTEHTGATWKSSSHIDVVGRDFDVWFDGDPIMEKSRYLRNGALV